MPSVTRLHPAVSLSHNPTCRSHVESILAKVFLCELCQLVSRCCSYSSGGSCRSCQSRMWWMMYTLISFVHDPIAKRAGSAGEQEGLWRSPLCLDHSKWLSGFWSCMHAWCRDFQIRIWAGGSIAIIIIIIIIIITSNDDPKPSTVISDQSPSG